MLVRTSAVAVELEEDTITGANAEVHRHSGVPSQNRTFSADVEKTADWPKWNIGSEVAWAAGPLL